MEIRMLLG